MPTLGDLAYAHNTGITEYERWPEGGQYILIPDMDGDLQPYEIVEAELDVQDTKVKRVECEHLFYELGTSNIRDYSLTNATPATFMAAALDNTRWQVGTIDGLYSSTTKDVNRDHCSALEALRYAEREWGARLKFRAEIQDGSSEFYVDLLQPVSEFQGVRFEFGRNLEGIRIKVDRRNIVTKLHGFGMGDEVDVQTGDPKPLTFENITGTTFVTNENARMLYGRYVGGTRQHIEDKYESSAETEQGLLWATQTQLERRSRPSVHIEASVKDLEKARIVDINTGDPVALDHEKIRLHDTAYVLARDKGVLAEVIAEITRIERPLKEPENTRLEIGDPLLFGSDEIREIESKVDWKDRRRRKLDRGRGPATITIASEDTSRVPWYADIIVPAGTTDFEEYFEQAIDLLPAEGGRIIILEGLYTYSAVMLITKDNVTIAGQGKGTKIQSVGGLSVGITGIRAAGRQGVTLQDLLLDGNSDTHTGGTHFGVSFREGSAEFVLSNVTATNYRGSGIYLSGVNDGNVNDCKLVSNTETGVYVSGFYGQNTDITIIGSRLKNNTNNGVRVDDGVRITIEANNCTQNGRFGVRLENVENSSLVGNNCLQSGASAGYSGIGLFDSNKNTVSGNVSNNNSYQGIYLLRSSDNGITDNVCDGSSGASGIYLGTGSDRNKVSNNNCSGNAGRGIGVESNYSTVQGNKCYDNADYGITILVGATGNQVTNNDLYGNTSGGLQDAGTGTVTTAGNRS